MNYIFLDIDDVLVFEPVPKISSRNEHDDNVNEVDNNVKRAIIFLFIRKILPHILIKCK